MGNRWEDNWLQTRTQVGWVDIHTATPEIYHNLGFKCGLEVHQQLDTKKKLFCRCATGIYHDFNNFDAEIVRHMRPTLSELGEYDGTALMEFRTRKQIIYRIKNDSACTYEVDDTPPFLFNEEAISHAMQIALLLKMNIVGELHITRKQYLDGSIPTGFQRTAILGIEGSFPISNKTIRVIQFSIEEDSCREVSDYRHTRIYYADRLGMPLIETVTYPDMRTPQEAAEAGQYIRFLARSSGKVRVGIGAAREDVNVSVRGGTRVEIKGVAHIAWIPKLTHNEAFRQKALLNIKAELKQRKIDPKAWTTNWTELPADGWKHVSLLQKAAAQNWKLVAVNLPGFRNLLSYFTQPGKCFADELADRLKVIACLEKPNMFHSEELQPTLTEAGWQQIAQTLKAGEKDAQILLWTPEEDLKTAVETITERCQLAFEGVPNETRKSLPNGITLFERVLPGPDRMYPDTDSAPISVPDAAIEEARKLLPVDLKERLDQLVAWQVPRDAYTYILRNNLMPVIEQLSAEHKVRPAFLVKLYAHTLKSLQGRNPLPFGHDRISDLFKFIGKRNLTTDILPDILKLLYKHPNMAFSSLLITQGYQQTDAEEIYKQIPVLHLMFSKFKPRPKRRPTAEADWIMGHLRKVALGNVSLNELRTKVDAAINEEASHA
jgi:glutamyl-tRNA(Gln) amidotransferase subunit E